jgi:uncharacterized protein YbbK (DUF523 family)
MGMIIISACLAGINCKYDGGNNLNKKILELVKKGKAIPLCPEQLGGLTTPREPAECNGDGSMVLNGKAKVITRSGRDVTDNFIKGAKEVLRLAKKLKVKKAILKARSPSCGADKIYDGSFSGRLIDGNGVLAALLKKNGIKVYNEENFVRR